MIIITGAAGFIGSCLVSKLNKLNYNDLILVDNFKNSTKHNNLSQKKYHKKIERDMFFEWLSNCSIDIECIFHIGARTDTTEFNTSIFNELNLNYSKSIFKFCSSNNIPLLYASSAATYGMGEFGFDDNHDIIEKLKPLNPYGASKNDFDKWILKQNSCPDFWCGFKFFNVYGPNEYHKGRMASVILHAAKQIVNTSKMNLFRSHKNEYKDGEQLRDFIYVKDVVDVLIFMFKNKKGSGIYNLGTGIARSFNDLTRIVFNTLEKKIQINYIDIPKDIRVNYQYFTKANMKKIIELGYDNTFTSLELGIDNYIREYILPNKYL